MAKVTFDYSRTAQFINKEEVENSKVLAEAAKKYWLKRPEQEMISLAGLIFR